MRHPLRWISFCTFAVFIYTVVPPPQSTYAAVATAWNRKVEIIVQESKIDATLTNFPVLLTKDNLPSEPCDADGTYPAQDGGGDIRFTTDEAGDSQIPLEVVRFETDNNPSLCEVELYVKIPTISSSTGTSIWMWYNTGDTNEQPAASSTYGSENVWSSYAGVWHMQEASGTRYDATGNSSDLTDVNTVTSATGKVGTTAASFDDTSSEYLYIGDNAALSMGSDVSWYMSAWARAHDLSAYNTIFAKKENNSSQREYLLYTTPTPRFAFDNYYNSGGSSVTLPASTFGSPSTNTWYHVGMRHDATGDELDIAINNGTKDPTSNGGDTFNGTGRFSIGANNTTGTPVDYMDGEIDEVRILKENVSDAWWKAEYENTSDPAAFAVEEEPVDVESSLNESVVRKAADESVTSSTTLQDDNHFIFALEANKTYVLMSGIFATSTVANPDIKIAFSIPAGATMDIGYFGQGGNNRVADLLESSGTASAAIPIAANGDTIIQAFGTVTTSGTAGNLKFQWAQNASNANATTVRQGSFMSVAEISE